MQKLILIIFFLGILWNWAFNSNTSDYAEEPHSRIMVNEENVCGDRFLFMSNVELGGTYLDKLKRKFGNKEIPVEIRMISQAKIYLIENKNDNISTPEFYKKAFAILEDEPFEKNVEIASGPDLAVRSLAIEKKRLGLPNHHEQDPKFESWGWKHIGANRVIGKYQKKVKNDVTVALLGYGLNYHKDVFKNNLWDAPADLDRPTFQVECGSKSVGVNFSPKSQHGECEPMDKSPSRHGTDVAGVIGGEGKAFGGNNSKITHRIKLLPIKVLNDHKKGCVSSVVQAWEFILAVNKKFYSGSNSKKKIMVANHSFGLTHDMLNKMERKGLKFLKKAIKRTNEKDLLLIASAGNAGVNIEIDPNDSVLKNVLYPGSLNECNIITVAATDDNDHLIPKGSSTTKFDSNFGPNTVDLSAPGIGICTTVKPGKCKYFGRTSAAAPFVSGAAALLIATCNANMSNHRIKSYLEKSAKQNRTLRKYVQHGRVNVWDAVQQCREEIGK